ncbi:TlpA family protein disulfide reductase, partial [Cupriavidus sp. CER94]|uniref:TlpA family protein disulfide reductase n=1 Tax=Cupriavidus sp. CER94 TaxID=3377036 RepID=UPI00381C63EA
MRGTPTLILIDADGQLRRQYFGSVNDLTLGADIAELILEARADSRANKGQPSALPAGHPASTAADDCASGACPVDTP